MILQGTVILFQSHHNGGGAVRMSETAHAWTVAEQRRLDAALSNFPKIDGEEAKVRWERIAAQVGRNMKDCVARYRQIRAKLQSQSDGPNREGPRAKPLASHLSASPSQQHLANTAPPPPANSSISPVSPPLPTPPRLGVSIGWVPSPSQDIICSGSSQKKSFTGSSGSSNPAIEPPKATNTARERFLAFSESGRVGKSTEKSSGEPTSKAVNAKQQSSFTGQKSDHWWASLDCDDPISLEPIADLPYPPFELREKNDRLLGEKKRKERDLIQGIAIPFVAYLQAFWSCVEPL